MGSLLFRLVAAWMLVLVARGDAALYLERSETNERTGGRLVREIARQAVWDVALHELGWPVRDAVLRDAADNADVWQVTVGFGTEIEVVLRQREEDAWTVRWRTRFPVPDETHDWVPAFVRNLTAERQEIANALRQFARVKPTWRPETGAVVPEDKDVPADVLGQFSLARALEAAWQQGPARVRPRLARCYATLGFVTGLRWSRLDTVFVARSLVLAEVGCAEAPGDAKVHATRGFCRALAGLHAAAIDDYGDVESGLALAYARFDVETLQKKAAGEQGERSLAAVLAVAAAALPVDRSLSSVVLAAVADSAPGSVRMYETMRRARGFENLQRCTRNAMGAFVMQLARHDQLPPRVQLLLQDDWEAEEQMLAATLRHEFQLPIQQMQHLRAVVRLPEVLAALRRSSTDTPMSWATLAVLLEDLAFTVCVNRLDFVADYWAAPTDRAREVAATLCKTHPDVDLLESFATTLPAVWQEGLLELQPRDVSHAMQVLINRLKRGDEQAGLRARALDEDAWKRLSPVQAALRYQNMRYGGSPRKEMIDDLAAISPHDPMIPIFRLRADPGDVLGKADALADQHRQHPAVPALLAWYLHADGKTDHSLKLARMAMHRVPNKLACETMVKIYLDRDDPASAERAVDLFAGAGMSGLVEQADVRKPVSYWYLRKGKYEDALPSVLANAAAYNAVYLHDAAYCYDGLQDYDNADRYWKRALERYPSAAEPYLRWVVLSGQGDRERATRAAHAFMGKHAPARQTETSYCYYGFMYGLAGDPERSRQWFERAVQKYRSPFAAMQLAVLALQDNDREEALRHLAFVIAQGDDIADSQRKYIRLAELFQASLQTDTPVEDDDLLALIQADGARQRTNINYFAGRLFELLGQAERGHEHLELVATRGSGAAWATMQARDHLRAGGKTLKPIAPHRYRKTWRED